MKKIIKIFKKPKELIKSKTKTKTSPTLKGVVKKIFGIDKPIIFRKVKTPDDLRIKERKILTNISFVRGQCQNLNNMHNVHKFVRTLKQEGITSKNIQTYTRLYPEHIFDKLGNITFKEKINILSLMGFDLGKMEKVTPRYLDFNPNLTAIYREIYPQTGSMRNTLREINKFYSIKQLARSFPMTQILEAIPYERIRRDLDFEEIKHKLQSNDVTPDTEEEMKKFAESIYKK